MKFGQVLGFGECKARKHFGLEILGPVPCRWERSHSHAKTCFGGFWRSVSDDCMSFVAPAFPRFSQSSTPGAQAPVAKKFVPTTRKHSSRTSEPKRSSGLAHQDVNKSSSPLRSPGPGRPSYRPRFPFPPIALSEMLPLTPTKIFIGIRFFRKPADMRYSPNNFSRKSPYLSEAKEKPSRG